MIKRDMRSSQCLWQLLRQLLTISWTSWPYAERHTSRLSDQTDTSHAASAATHLLSARDLASTQQPTHIPLGAFSCGHSSGNYG